MSKHLLKGKKFSRSHSTYIAEADGVIADAKALPAVTKIVLGIIRSIGSGPPRLSFHEVDAGLQVKVRGANSVQTLFVYTSDKIGVVDSLTASWKARHS